MAEDIKPQGEMGDGASQYANLGREDEPDSRVEDVQKAEHMAHAAKPDMDDALALDQMAGKTKDRQDNAEGPMPVLNLKTRDLQSAAEVSRIAAEQGADAAGRAYDKVQEAQKNLDGLST